MNHDQAVELLRSCPCECHTSQGAECWCRTRATDPLEISHNDRVRMFGRCDCTQGKCPRVRTSPEMRRAIEDLEEQNRERRIARGRLSSSDLAHIVRNPHRYPHLFGRGTREG